MMEPVPGVYTISVSKMRSWWGGGH